MRIMEKNLIKSKFRGSLIGALLGDCLGSPFEGEVMTKGAKLTLKKYFDKLEGPFFLAPFKPYTDDTAMTKSVAKNLIEHKKIVHKELAMNFVKEYYKSGETDRGYGSNVVQVFAKLRKTNCDDPLGPALQQFNGAGSHGNGAAMRVAPVALFCLNKPEKLIQLVTDSAIVTHTHKFGIDGAILQALAVHQSLNLDPKDKINPEEFVKELLLKMEEVEPSMDKLGLPQSQQYKIQLNEILRLLANPERAHPDGVIDSLGHSVSAQFSVPTAIFCFLRAQSVISEIVTDNPFRRTLQYAISLGGDTDTIASMAGAICGAFYGDSIISENVMKHCEGSEETIKMADSLLEISYS